MGMIASNLGQILGRLMYTDDRAQEPQPTKSKRGFREAQVLELVREKGEVSCRDQVAALGVTAGHGYVLLSHMRRDGSLVRGSTACSYALPTP